MTATVEILLVLLVVLVAAAVIARRLNTAPSIALVIAGVALALTPGLPTIELAPEFVLLVILPPLIYSAGVSMSSNARGMDLYAKEHLPVTATWPRSYGSSPAIARSTVVFPDPDGPMIATSSPRATDKLTPASTARGPRRRCRSSTVSTTSFMQRTFSSGARDGAPPPRAAGT